ncbi:uncharacterized protein UV8b_04615 [Ustilaginoidea virens]|uniref:Uncharacterized protein n=1 Tax=Ustilaginoidea virens TaxID=1159556 RepID=A0A8E5HRL9_USTVR|nr:uncharacterized protein UV8b_04615 [Ustilaginoidea virens]QUC20374.1 hypothetical protein UV8b_04615 [Ustilaginoidea virens]
MLAHPRRLDDSLPTPGSLQPRLVRTQDVPAPRQQGAERPRPSSSRLRFTLTVLDSLEPPLPASPLPAHGAPAAPRQSFWKAAWPACPDEREPGPGPGPRRSLIWAAREKGCFARSAQGLGRTRAPPVSVSGDCDRVRGL